MTHQTDGAETLNNQSNLSNDDMGFSSYDHDAVKAAEGRYSKHTNWVSDEDMNNNPNNVIRDGSRVSAAAGYKAGDIVMVNGMEIPFETAQDMGLIASPNAPQAQPQVNPELSPEDLADQAPEDTPNHFEGTDLVKAQWDMQTNGEGMAALNEFAGDFVENGELTQASFDKAMGEHGVSENMMSNQFSQVQDIGNNAVYNALEVGDSLGVERMEFLSHIHETGTSADAKLVRSVIAGAALGHLSTNDIIAHFDTLADKYGDQ